MVTTRKQAGVEIKPPQHFGATEEDTKTDTTKRRRSSAASSGKASQKAAGAAATTAKAKAPKFPYEFGGPLGAAAMLIFLPLVVYGLYGLCPNGRECLPFPRSLDSLKTYHLIAKRTWSLPALHELWDLQAFVVYVGWFAFQVLLERVLPGEVVQGVALSTGERLNYKLNGHLAFWISLLVVAEILPLYGDGHALSYVYEHYLQLITAAIVFSFLLSVYIYATSFIAGRLLAEGGKSGNPIYDFFIGRELNPRIKDFDWKYFCELRPGLIGWAVLNLGMIQHSGGLELAWKSRRELVWVVFLQCWYVLDALYQEKAILTTMDITTDGFGFMLVFGDLAWVPFTYTIQARYLVDHDPALSDAVVYSILVLYLLGYYIFRQANSTKDAFRRDPSSLPHIKYLQTKRGTKLMTSGWWGWARKINYTGDWVLGLSWCLLTGFDSIIPYFYAIYFAGLLIHRAARDDHACSVKYGDDWETYKKLVPYKFIPKVC